MTAVARTTPRPTHRIASAWSSWVSFTSERESGLTLSLFRIAIGLTLLLSLGTMASARLVDVLWVGAESGGVLHIGQGSWLLGWMGGPTAHNVWILFWIACISGTFFTLGLAGRVSAFIALEAYQGLYSTSGFTSHSYDVLLTNALWLSVLGDTSRTLSLDAWLRKRSFFDDTPISAWPRYIAILQILVVYVTTGLQKLSPTWTPFGGYSALYWVLQDPDWRRWDGRYAASLYPLTQIGTAVTWFWEVLSPLMLLVLYYRRTRTAPGRLRGWSNRWDLRFPYLTVGIMMHLGILLLLNVGVFSLVAVSFYVTFFRPDEIEAWLRRRGQWLRRKGKRSMPA
jgi:hypothetical protein